MVILRSQTGDPTDIRDRHFIRMVTGGVKEDLTGIGGGGGKSLIISKTAFSADLASWNLIQVKLNERKERNVTFLADLCY